MCPVLSLGMDSVCEDFDGERDDDDADGEEEEEEGAGADEPIYTAPRPSKRKAKDDPVRFTCKFCNDDGSTDFIKTVFLGLLFKKASNTVRVRFLRAVSEGPGAQGSDVAVLDAMKRDGSFARLWDALLTFMEQNVGLSPHEMACFRSVGVHTMAGRIKNLGIREVTIKGVLYVRPSPP